MVKLLRRDELLSNICIYSDRIQLKWEWGVRTLVGANHSCSMRETFRSPIT